MHRSRFFHLHAIVAVLIIALVPLLTAAQATLLADVDVFGFDSFRLSQEGGSSWTLGGAIYFNVEDDQHNRSVWRYDGSSVQKVRDGEITDGSAERIQDRLVFRDKDHLLYRLDQSGVSLLSGEQGATYHQFTNGTGIRFQDRLFLPGVVQTSNVYNDGVIWATDGYDLSRAFTSPYRYGNLPYRLAATSEGVYLFFHLWNYDNGTTNYTGEDVWFLEDGRGPGSLVHQFEAVNGQHNAIENAVAVDNALYLAVNRSGSGPLELWRMTTSSLETISLDANISPLDRTLTRAGSRLYFKASNNVWYLEGTQAVRVDDRYNFSGDEPYMVHGNDVYFILRDDAAAPWQLFKQSATGSDVVRVDSHPFIHLPVSKVDYIVRPEGIYFSATDTRSIDGRGSVREYWFTDGFSITRLSDNVSDDLTAHWLVGVLGDELLFSGYRWPDPYQLWVVNLNESGSGSSQHTLSGFDPAGGAVNWIIDNAAPVDSGYVFGPNIYSDRAKATAFSLPDQATVGALNAVDIWWGHKRDGLSGGTYQLHVYDGSPQTGPQGAPMFTKQYNVVDIVGDADPATPPSQMTYTFDTPVTVGSEFFVALDFGQYGADLIGGLALAAGDLAGQSVPEVWEQWSDGEWHTVSSAWLNDSNGWPLWAQAQVSVGGSVASEPDAILPESFALHGNYPNPFNPSTEIGYTLTSTGHVTLDVFDITGRLVQRLVNGPGVPGHYEVTMSGANLPSGLYFYRLQQNAQMQTRSMILLK